MNKKQSKFSDLLAVKEEKASELTPEQVEEIEPVKSEKVSAPTEELPERESGFVKPKDRPVGKRSNPDWQQFTAYARRDTLRRVEVALINLGSKNKLSDLLDDLMSSWLESPQPPHTR
jgi:hypothetical protein